MKKVLRILFGLAFSICIVIGGYVLMKQIEYNQMVEIVKSDEVREIIVNRLNSYDKNALTEVGIIKSYSVDDTSIRHNPMGGISFTVHVNRDKELYVFYTINKDSQSGKFVLEGGGNSSRFEKIIAQENGE
ncbi:DUF1310 domain-containing protein [Streptococcus suis]|nr:DUF1310 domain-containing protein [Streptococcus suis]